MFFHSPSKVRKTEESLVKIMNMGLLGNLDVHDLEQLQPGSLKPIEIGRN